MNLTAIFKKYLTGQNTGQLVVKFAGVPHLCKISIDKGKAVYITLGTMGPEDTLDFIIDKTSAQANFIPGVPPRKRLQNPINETLLAIINAQESFADSPAPDQASAEAPGEAAAEKLEGGIPPETVEAVIEDFIDIVGPLGTVLAENSISQVGYSRGSEIASDTYAAFLKALLEEIPEKQQNEFLTRHRK